MSLDGYILVHAYVYACSFKFLHLQTRLNFGFEPLSL